MPVYTYHCDACDHQFDQFQSIEEKPLKVCPKCGEQSLFKVYRPAGIVFKGSGYYVTDNRSAKPALAGSNGKSESSGNGKNEKAKEKTSEKKIKTDS